MEITEELIEVAALAMINAVRTSRGWPAMDAIPDDFQDADKWRFEARAAITAVAPLIAAGEREAIDALAKAIHQDRQFPPTTRHGACLVREAIRARGAAGREEG